MEPFISSRPVSYARRAGRAAAYPLRGIWYFSRTREFWPLFLGRLLPLSLISLVVYFILFAFAFLPQFAFLAIFQGWGAWVNAVVLVLGEGLVIIQGLFEGFFVDECRVDVYDVCNADYCRRLSLTSIGYLDSELSRRLGRSPPRPVPRRAECCQNAWQAYQPCHIHAMEYRSDHRAYHFSAFESDPLRWNSGIHHDYRRKTRKAGALPLVPASRPVQGGAEEGTQASRLGKRMVWLRGHDSGAYSHSVFLLSLDLFYRSRAMDCADGARGATTRPGSGRRPSCTSAVYGFVCIIAPDSVRARLPKIPIHWRWIGAGQNCFVPRIRSAE